MIIRLTQLSNDNQVFINGYTSGVDPLKWNIINQYKGKNY